ncbi:Ig-like domain-containing protein [Candidatus Latescibacterota bacterium]
MNYLEEGKPSYRLFPWLAITVIYFIVFSCAKQGFPPGGPEDRISPFLADSTPASQAVGVSTDLPVVLEFSESMNEESIENNLFIVPIPQSWPELEWKSRSKELIIRFNQPLRENTTYVISIGSSARDMRNNQLDDSIMLPFSTGDMIENGKIRGKVIPYHFFDDKKENNSGVDVVAFNMNNSPADPDPGNDIPSYMTQSGSEGTYEIVGLSGGLYRLFAIGDRDQDGFYTEGYDMIGVAPHDVSIAEGDSVVFAPDITISEHDTSHVQLFSIKVPDNQRVELYFNSSVDPSSAKVRFDGLEIIDWFVLEERPMMVSAATEVQQNGMRYTIGELEITDRGGNNILPLDFVPEFTGTDQPDTTALAVVELYPELLTPDDGNVTLIFNRVLDIPDDPTGILTDETKSEMLISQTGPNKIEMIARDGWLESRVYSIFFDTEKLKGCAGNRLNETDSELSFRVVSSDTLGFIEGSIADSTGTPSQSYRLIFKNLDADRIEEITLFGSDEWSTGPVLPGRYICFGYRDDDGDGALNRGSFSPYKASEQAYAYPDTIKVDSRWTNGDNLLIFR